MNFFLRQLRHFKPGKSACIRTREESSKPERSKNPLRAKYVHKEIAPTAVGFPNGPSCIGRCHDLGLPLIQIMASKLSSGALSVLVFSRSHPILPSYKDVKSKLKGKREFRKQVIGDAHGSSMARMCMDLNLILVSCRRPNHNHRETNMTTTVAYQAPTMATSIAFFTMTFAKWVFAIA
ncbi:hypothetical protein AMTR_s00045p00145880 [Amborella trichopoda]|uniref:Uncharacterized protein n=1 Tax=Amborella trichopoda TaxID=13333 RepID=W1P530_AMBTC|nr:hypothetical protein AMTR_s00045p00145880 [Amborella trichopoda]